VIVLEVDRRARRYISDLSLAERIEREARVVREAEIVLAKSLLEMRTKRSYIEQGCSCVEHFVARLGYEPHEARRLLRLAESMAASPLVEERIQERALSVPKAVEMAPVLTEPTLFAEKDEWLERSKDESYSSIRRRARHRIAEVRGGRAMVAVTVHADDDALDAFERARVIASRKAGKILSRDQTFELVVLYYVEKNDPLLVKDGKRRVGPTDEIPDSRYIPISVQRDVRRRSGDTCEFPACCLGGLTDFAHRRSHNKGGSREARNVLQLCKEHHFQQELGIVVPVGAAANLLWFQPDGLIVTKTHPGGYMPRTDRERRALAALRARQRGERQPKSAAREAADAHKRQ
jgi:hypothetical protein